MYIINYFENLLKHFQYCYRLSLFFTFRKNHLNIQNSYKFFEAALYEYRYTETA